MESLIENGWNYISAIFQILIDESDKQQSLIEPHYIFRGITKRWFTTSSFLGDNKKLRNKNKKEVLRKILFNNDKNLNKEGRNWLKEHQDSIEKLESSDIYKFLYLRMKCYIENNKDMNPKELLNNLMKHPEDTPKDIPTDYELCVPEYINSGAVVRLKKGALHPSNLDYITYIKHMLNDLRLRFPKYNEDNISDIEILADVQHMGAATCLADFSTNFLTSLWFATQNLNDEIGYLFCYDINKALIYDDKLFILNKNHVHRSIDDLLRETTKKTKYSGNKLYRYWLWMPSNLNQRIIMQDSVFLFGLEPFRIKENGIIAIPIPHCWKRPIQHVLKSFFGITAESVYCDVDGYADANSKTRPYTKSFNHFFNEEFDNNINVDSSNKENIFEYLQCGMDCLFQGEYGLSLKYLSLYEAKTKNKFAKEQFQIIKKNVPNCRKRLKMFVLSTDVLYSKGLCLKHLGDEFGAIAEFKEAYETCKELNASLSLWIEKRAQNEKELYKTYQEYIQSKQEKAFNDLLDMYFATHQYDESVKLISESSSGNDNWLYLKIKEARCRHSLEKYLYSLKRYNDRSKALEHCDFRESICQDLNYKNIKEQNEEEQPLVYVLDSFFDSLLSFICHPIKKITTDENNKVTDEVYYFDISQFNKFQQTKEKISKLTINEEKDKNGEILINWDLNKIEAIIHEIGVITHEDYYKELVKQLRQMSNFIISIQCKTKYSSQKS